MNRLCNNKLGELLIARLCTIGNQDESDISDEDDIANSCISATCFATGTVVGKDEEIAKSLAFHGYAEKKIYGFSIASHFFAEHSKMALVDYCVTQGADPVIESTNSCLSLFDILEQKKDFN